MVDNIPLRNNRNKTEISILLSPEKHGRDEVLTEMFEQFYQAALPSIDALYVDPQTRDALVPNAFELFQNMVVSFIVDSADKTPASEHGRAKGLVAGMKFRYMSSTNNERWTRLRNSADLASAIDQVGNNHELCVKYSTQHIHASHNPTMSWLNLVDLEADDFPTTMAATAPTAVATTNRTTPVTAVGRTTGVTAGATQIATSTNTNKKRRLTWTTQEKMFFESLLPHFVGKKNCWREVAVEMNKRFLSDKFTRVNCRSQYETWQKRNSRTVRNDTQTAQHNGNEPRGRNNTQPIETSEEENDQTDDDEDTQVPSRRRRAYDL